MSQGYYMYILLAFPLKMTVILSLLLYPMKKRRTVVPFWARTVICIVVLFAAALFAQPTEMMLAKFRYPLLYMLCLACVFFCFDMNFRNCLLCVTSAYAIEHIMFCVSEVYKQIRLGSGELGKMDLVVIEVISFGTLLVIFFVFIRKFNEQQNFGVGGSKLALLTCSILIITVGISTIEGMIPYTVESRFNWIRILFCCLRMMCLVLTLTIQTGLFARSKLEQESHVLNILLESEKKRYSDIRDVIEQVNVKYHDLKHILPYLKKGQAENQTMEDYIGSIEASLQGFDLIVETGNEALDNVISKTVLSCQRNNIRFTYMVDGQRMNFMSTVDIYALIGNLLENAFEEVVQLDEEHRIIDLKIYADGTLLKVCSQNCIRGSVRFTDGMPVTTKEDESLHGFGTKSIAHIVKKYSGMLDFGIQDSMFSVNILFCNQE